MVIELILGAISIVLLVDLARKTKKVFDLKDELEGYKRQEAGIVNEYNRVSSILELYRLSRGILTPDEIKLALEKKGIKNGRRA